MSAAGRWNHDTHHHPRLFAAVVDHPPEPASFDGVTSVATVHHLDATAALTGLREHVRPGGTLAVLGCARSTGPQDLPFEAAGTP